MPDDFLAETAFVLLFFISVLPSQKLSSPAAAVGRRIPPVILMRKDGAKKSHGPILFSLSPKGFCQKPAYLLLRIQRIHDLLGPVGAAVRLELGICFIDGQLAHGNVSDQLILQGGQIAV